MDEEEEFEAELERCRITMLENQKEGEIVEEKVKAVVRKEFEVVVVPGPNAKKKI